MFILLIGNWIIQLYHNGSNCLISLFQVWRIIHCPFTNVQQRCTCTKLYLDHHGGTTCVHHRLHSLPCLVLFTMVFHSLALLSVSVQTHCRWYTAVISIWYDNNRWVNCVYKTDSNLGTSWCGNYHFVELAAHIISRSVLYHKAWWCKSHKCCECHSRHHFKTGWAIWVN